MSAAKFCRKRHLQRGTFLRWRTRLSDSDLITNQLVEIRDRSDPDDTVLEVRIGSDVRIAVKAGADLGFVGSLIAAIRRAV